MSRVELRFASMGGEACVRLESDSLEEAALDRLAGRVRALLGDVEQALSRFRGDSELSALNRDPRRAVPASPILRRLGLAVRWAGARSGGLVDATRLNELEEQGYSSSHAGWAPAPLERALAVAPPRRPALPHPARDHARVGVDAEGRVVRPPGVRLDSGGLGKGLAADLAAATLSTTVRYAISCGGDLAVGGPAGRPWEIAVASAATGGEAHRLVVRTGGVATSGVHSRLWRRPEGGFAHHLLDPASGRPAWTGVVAVTAVAASALEAEVAAKTALLSGPAAARALLGRGRGGVLQHDDGSVEVVPGLPVVRLAPPRRAVAA